MNLKKTMANVTIQGKSQEYIYPQKSSINKAFITIECVKSVELSGFRTVKFQDKHSYATFWVDDVFLSVLGLEHSATYTKEIIKLEYGIHSLEIRQHGPNNIFGEIAWCFQPSVTKVLVHEETIDQSIASDESSNPNITMQDVFPEKSWNWNALSRNPNTTVKDVSDDKNVPDEYKDEELTTVQINLSPNTPFKEEKIEAFKIAYCFLIYEEIETEPYWVDFFKGINSNLYNIYIHPKRQDKYHLSDFMRPFVLPFSSPTTYYFSTSIIQAVNKMFDYAYTHDSSNQVFVLVSGNCLPVKSFDHIYDYFTTHPSESIIPKFFHDTPEHISKGNHSLNAFLKPTEIIKHHLWCCFQRELIQIFRQNPMVGIFQGINFPEELYYQSLITHFQLPNKIQQCIAQQVGQKVCLTMPSTFTNWSDDKSAYPFRTNQVTGPGPFSYQYISSAELEFLRTQSPFPFFARKFKKNFTVHQVNLPIEFDWYYYITHNDVTKVTSGDSHHIANAMSGGKITTKTEAELHYLETGHKQDLPYYQMVMVDK